MENKKGSLFLVLLKSIVSPFSLLILVSGVVSLIGSYFLGKGYSDGIILLVLYLLFVIIHFILAKRDNSLKEKSFYKSYIELTKIVASLALFMVTIVVISSLLHQVDVPSIIKGASLPFIIGLPLGFLPLFLLINNKEETVIDSAFKKCFSDLLPILVAQFILTLVFPILGIKYPFNSNELIIVNLIIVCLAFAFDFIEIKKGEKASETASLGKKVLLKGIVVGFLFSIVLLIIYLIAPFKELMDSNQSININNIQSVLNSELDVYSSGQCYLFVGLSFGSIIYLYFFTNKLSEIFNSKRFIRSVFYLVALLIIVAFIFIPWIKTFVFSSYMSLLHLVFALLGGISLSLFALIYKLIEKKVTNNKKSD